MQLGGRHASLLEVAFLLAALVLAECHFKVCPHAMSCCYVCAALLCRVCCVLARECLPSSTLGA